MIRAIIALAFLLAAPAALVAQEASVNPGINKPFEKPRVAEWVERFESDGRDLYDHRQETVEACKIKQGMTVADIGAGTGLFTRLFSPLVGPQGKVYAVDITAEFVEHVERTCKAHGMDNVVGIKCSPESVEMPPSSVDLAFICDTYHHFEFPQKMMRSIHDALKPGGQVILVDFRRVKGRSTDWVMSHVRAGQEVFAREIEEVGFRQVEEKHDLLRESYFLRFEKVKPHE
jgi:predicted methyltransferase